MDKDRLKNLRAISFEDTPKFSSLAHKQGTHKETLSDGAILSAHSDSKHTVSISGTDKAGKPLELFPLSLSTGDTAKAADGARKCFICYSDPTEMKTVCVEMACGTTVVVVQPPS